MALRAKVCLGEGVQECLPDSCEGNQAQQLDHAEHSPPGRTERDGGEMVGRAAHLTGQSLQWHPGWPICIRELIRLPFMKEWVLSPEVLLTSLGFLQGTVRNFFSALLSAGWS